MTWGVSGANFRAMAWQPPRVGGVPKEPVRAWIRFAVGALLAVQVVVPASYYQSSDPYDERFSWRMFSAVRVHRCAVVASDVIDHAEQQIDLPKTIHNAWIQMLSRNRPSVVKAFLRYRCETRDPSAVKVRTQCIAPNGARVPDIVWQRDCRTGEIDEPEIHLERLVSDEAGGEPAGGGEP